jgi:hypothetical protein
MSEEDSESNLSIIQWTEELLENEKKIRNFLDSVSEKQSAGSEAREMLRKFGQDSKHSNTFAPIYYSVIDSEQFFEDVVEEFDDESIQVLKEIGVDYSHMESELEAMYSEIFFDHWNPITGFDSEIDRLDNDGTPLITIRAYSGDTMAFKLRNNPPSIMNISASLIHNLDNRLNPEASDWELPKQQKKYILEEIEHINQHLDEMYETLDLEEIDD